jgi:hypothetical protein
MILQENFKYLLLKMKVVIQRVSESSVKVDGKL